MLLSALAALAVCGLGLLLVVLVTLRFCKRIGLDPIATLMFFGIVERPLEVPRARRRRLGELVLDQLG
jgi:hypothetical protein